MMTRTGVAGWLLVSSLLVVHVAAAQRLLIVSDTQKPLWIETLQVKADENEDATRRILKAIAADSTADALIHLGDITALSGLDREWSLIDEALREIRVPILYTRGNHDYLPIRSWADEKIRERLGPDAGRRNVWRFGSLAILLFDSNEGKLSADENREQERWFDSTLTSLDEDESIRWVVAGCHHSPYTNSTIIAPSEHVRERYIPSFVIHAKTTLFISGHAHAYERFEEDGKTFLVLGGGGGLRQPLLTGNQQRWADKTAAGTELRPFHYSVIDVVGEELRVRVFALRDDRTGFDVGEGVMRGIESMSL